MAMVTIMITDMEGEPANTVKIQMGGDQPVLPERVEDYTLAQTLGMSTLMYLRSIAGEDNLAGVTIQ